MDIELHLVNSYKIFGTPEDTRTGTEELVTSLKAVDVIFSTSMLILNLGDE